MAIAVEAAVAIDVEVVVVLVAAIAAVTAAEEDSRIKGSGLCRSFLFFTHGEIVNKIKHKELPIFGAGPEWTEGLEEELADNFIEFNCFELIPENFVDRPHRKYFLDLLAKAQTPVLIHAVGLSLGTDEPLKRKHLDQVLAVGAQVNMVSFSEHLSMTESGGIEIGQLTPIPWSIKAADVVIRKIEQIQKVISVPFALEHTAHKFFYPTNELSEPEFINRILDRTGCDLMLDLHNLYCNSRNANYDPHRWLEEVKINKVTSIHLAGGYVDKYGTLQDAHNEAVPEPVWALLDHVLEKITPQAIIIERTSNYPGLDPMMAEIDRADRALKKSQERTQTSHQLLAYMQNAGGAL